MRAIFSDIPLLVGGQQVFDVAAAPDGTVAVVIDAHGQGKSVRVVFEGNEAIGFGVGMIKAQASAEIAYAREQEQAKNVIRMHPKGKPNGVG